MWDVKSDSAANLRSLHAFYLNYVGCKVQQIYRGTHQTRSSFTLTMWDVKSEEEEEKKGGEEEFYLNYVGCKDATTQMRSITSMSFTLTMWDVKDFEREV